MAYSNHIKSHVGLNDFKWSKCGTSDVHVFNRRYTYTFQTTNMTVFKFVILDGNFKRLHYAKQHVFQGTFIILDENRRCVYDSWNGCDMMWCIDRKGNMLFYRNLYVYEFRLFGYMLSNYLVNINQSLFCFANHIKYWIVFVLTNVKIQIVMIKGVFLMTISSPHDFNFHYDQSTNSKTEMDNGNFVQMYQCIHILLSSVMSYDRSRSIQFSICFTLFSTQIY